MNTYKSITPMKNIYLLFIMCLILLAGCKNTKEESMELEGLTHR